MKSYGSGKQTKITIKKNHENHKNHNKEYKNSPEGFG